MNAKTNVIPLRLLLLLAPLIIFIQVCWHGFLGYDDPMNIIDNPHTLSLNVANLLYFWKNLYLNLYIPLTYNLWALLTYLAGFFPSAGPGPNPVVFHAANLLLHLANTILVFKIGKRLIHDDLSACAGALLFAVHPIQAEAVAWATGLKDLLAAFFSFLAIEQYLRYRENAGGQNHHYLRYGLALLCFLCAILSKPSAITVPVVLGLLCFGLLSYPWKSLLNELGPWLVLALPVIVITQIAQPLSAQSYVPEIWQRPLIAGDAISFYLAKLIFPMDLGPDYGRTPNVALQHSRIYLTGTLPYLIGAYLLWTKRKIPFTFLSMSLVALLPTLGFFSFAFQKYSTVTDRYLYFAMLGPALGIGWLVQRYHRRRSFLPAFLVILLLLGGQCFMQARYWRNDEEFYLHALKVNPDSWIAAYSLGIICSAKNQLEPAAEYFERAIAAKNDYAEAYNDLGRVRHLQGRMDEAGKLFARAYSLKPDFAPAAANLGNYFIWSGDLDQAKIYYTRALSLDPSMSRITALLDDIALKQIKH